MPHDVTRLYLLRHAHAGFAETGQRDFDRRLDDKGEREARFMAETMAREGWTPEVLVSSSATRCRQTSAAVLERLGDGTAAEIDGTLYEGSLQTYLGIVNARREQSMMLVGHNPVIEEMFWQLAGEAAARDHLHSFYPTAGLAVLDRAENGWRLAAMVSPPDDL